MVRAQTHLEAMKALKMKDGDLETVLRGGRSESGMISSYDLNIIQNLSMCVFNVPEFVDAKITFEDIQAEEAKMTTKEVNGAVLLTITDEQADRLMSKHYVTIVAAVKVLLDAYFETPATITRCVLEGTLSRSLALLR